MRQQHTRPKPRKLDKELAEELPEGGSTFGYPSQASVGCMIAAVPESASSLCKDAGGVAGSICSAHTDLATDPRWTAVP